MRLIERLRGVIVRRRPVAPAQPVEYRPIGVVRSKVRESRVDGWEDVRSDIVLREDLVEALDGIDGFSHVIVVFHLHGVPEEAHTLRLAVGTDAAERGVLATRSQRRPNPIGVSVVAVVQRLKGVLQVQGLDAIDGTPVLDIKPYLPAYDAVSDAKLPGWAVRDE